MKRAWGSLVVLVGLAPAAPPAHACDTASCALVTRGLYGLLPKQALRFDIAFRHTDQSDKRRGSEEAAVVIRPKIDLERDLMRPAFHSEQDGRESFVQLDLAYGLTSRVMVLASVPLTVQRTYDVSHFGFQQQYDTGGVGDTLLGVRMAVGPRGLIGGFAFQLPTGNYRVAGDYDGSILDPTLQPGNGSFSYVASLQYIRPAGGFDWSAAASYQINTANDEDYQFGNVAIAAVTASRRVVRGLAASLQVKYVNQARNEFRAWGLPPSGGGLVYQTWGVPATGGTFVYLTPGLTARIPGGLSGYGYFQVIPYRNVNEAQLTPRTAFLLGFSKTFEHKRRPPPAEPLP